ncbi:glycosyltransferase family 39 protein [Acidobacterium sp. S8]|uniref:ArnT family glycosyltransferase n=1 Tax=Acidobacterium sp. S8 TaxID=1641854 RepID=UPI00131B9A0F|nr:glycosyltransferase family 39 protein [Acidobacterium sp. S8]
MKRFLFPIFGLWLLLYGSFALVRPPLLDDADALHAEAAREMLLNHDWVTLHIDGVRYLAKAPLLYWSIATSFRIFGEHDWAARLPLALYSLALFFVIFALGRRLFGSAQAGFYTAVSLLTASGIFGFTRILLPDAILCLWLSLAIYFFWKSLEEPAPSLATAAGFAACCALAVLTKGLIGLGFPFAIVLVYLFFTRNLRHLLRWHPAIGALVFLVIAAPWHILAALRNPNVGSPTGPLPTQGNMHGFLWFYFMNEHFRRYMGQTIPHSSDSVPLLIFWLLLFVFIAPWFVFAIKALFHQHWGAALRREEIDQRQRVLLLLAIWAVAVMLFFSFSARQEYYVLPALPPLALLAGYWLAEDEIAPSCAGQRTAWVLFVVGVLAAIASALFAAHFKPLPVGTDVTSVVRDATRTHRLFFGHFFDLTLRALGAFRISFVITTAALLVGVSANLWFRLKDKARLANCFLIGTVTAFLIAAHLALNTLSPVLSSQILANAIKPEMDQDDVIIVNGRFEYASSLAFYLDRQVQILNGRSGGLWYGSFFPDAPKVFIENGQTNQLWSGNNRVFLWTPLDQVPQLPGQTFVIGRSGGKEILSNRPGSHGAEF